MKKVLIITYYWPPAGGAGVQRWLKFAKYLPDFGWEPIIYTPDNPEAPVKDESLNKDVNKNITVLTTPIWEPFEIYKSITGKSKQKGFSASFLEEEKGNNLMNRLSVWIRGNMFIPDAKRFWIKPSVKFLIKWLKSNPVDLIVSTGPPHSLHLIANKVHKTTGIKWVADFRDPWTQIDFYRKLNLSKLADKKHHRLEKEVLESATEIVVVGDTMANEFKLVANRNIHIITNGFDKEDVSDSKLEFNYNKFSIVHVGSMNADRNHEIFWKVIKDCIENDDEFTKYIEVNLIGKNDVSVTELIEKYQLREFVSKVDYIPHNEVVNSEAQAAVLYLPLNNTPNAKGILTGKFFEYLAAKRPILAIGPEDGDLAEILNDSKAGLISDFNDYDKLKENVLYYFSLFKERKLEIKEGNISKFERSELTKELAKLFDKLV